MGSVEFGWLVSFTMVMSVVCTVEGIGVASDERDSRYDDLDWIPCGRNMLAIFFFF